MYPNLHKGKAENKIFVVNRRFVIEDVIFCHPLPSWSACGLDDRGQAVAEQCPGLAQVDDVENYPLVFLSILHRKVEPEPEI